MTYVIIMNTGDYRELNVKTREEAESYMHCLFTEKEIEELEAEVIES